MGAWIETRDLIYVRQMKLVAPLVGAWIETWVSSIRCNSSIVAPLVGAWIETPNPPEVRPYNLSHPSWVRGLKLFCFRLFFGKSQSHPSWVRGLKHIYTYHLCMII